MSPPRRKCNFNSELQKEYPFMKLKSSVSPHVVYCEICKSEVDISNSGRSSIKAHLTKNKHRLAASASATSNKLVNFFKKDEISSENLLIAAKEGTVAYHTIKHMQSFRSLDCTSKLISCLFEPKFMSARTKTEAIVKNVFAKEAKLRLDNALEKAHFVSITIDSSNHNEIKIVPLLVRYFDDEKGIQIKLLQLQDLPGETSEQLNDYVFNTLSKFNLVSKCVGLSADNTNTNFGGSQRRGKNNLFTKLTSSCGKSIVGIGCVAHIFNNCIQNATDCLPIDVEVIVVKIYKHFYIYTVRVAELKSLCETVDVEYKKMLSFSKTRFLSLMPAVERIIKMYNPLRSYFLSLKNCPTILKQFFENPTGEIWMWFVHNVSSLFHQAILNVEGDKVCATEAALEYFSLKEKLESRLNELFVPSKVRESLSKLESMDPDKTVNYRQEFSETVRGFYSNCVNYLQQWTTNLSELKLFEWVGLRKEVTWNAILLSWEACKETIGDEFDEDACFDEFSLLKNFATSEKIDYWNSQESSTENRWLEFFKYMEAIPYQTPPRNLKIICQFALCLPGTSTLIVFIYVCQILIIFVFRHKRIH